MATLYGATCTLYGANTGRADCDIKIGRIAGHMAIKRNGFISQSATLNADNLYTLLQAAVIADDPNVRVYPIGNFEITADNSQERTQATAAGTGNTARLRDAKKGWTHTLWASFCQSLAYQKFDDQQGNYDFYLYTETNQFIAVNRNGNAGGLRFSSYDVSPYNEVGDDSEAYMTISCLIQNTREWREELIVITPTDGELSELEGLRDAQPYDLNAHPLPLAGTFKVGVSTGCGGGAGATSLIALFEEVLEDTDNWVVTNAKTKAVITVTSITASADKSYLTFVMPTTSPYVAGDGVKFKLAGVDTLTTAGMVGYEGQYVIIPNLV